MLSPQYQNFNHLSEHRNVLLFTYLSLVELACVLFYTKLALAVYENNQLSKYLCVIFQQTPSGIRSACARRYLDDCRSLEALSEAVHRVNRTRALPMPA